MYSGERVTPHAMLTVTIAQGSAAYDFVGRSVAGTTVLDVACGDGYGANLLAEYARSVVAIDRDADTIRRARAAYPRPNLEFVCADIFDLPPRMQGRRFDVVSCFQFLEHVNQQREFLRLLAGLAHPGGRVAVSTPNRNVFPTFNPYHAREVDPEEFRSLFAGDFPSVEFFGVFGDEKVLQYRASKQRLGNLLLRADVFRARTWLPRKLLCRVYDVVSFLLLKRLTFWRNRDLVTRVTTGNFSVRPDRPEGALDLLAVARVPVPVRSEPAEREMQPRRAVREMA